MRSLWVVGVALAFWLLPVTSLRAYGVRHHHGARVATGVAYYPGVSYYPAFATSYVQPGVSFVPSGFVPSGFVPSGYGCYGGTTGSSLSFVPMTGLNFVPSAFPGISSGCFGSSSMPGTSSVQPSALNLERLRGILDVAKQLREFFGGGSGGGGDGSNGEAATHLKKINATLKKMDKKLDQLLKKAGKDDSEDQEDEGRTRLDPRKAERGPFGPQSVPDQESQSVRRATHYQKAKYALQQARDAKGAAGTATAEAQAARARFNNYIELQRKRLAEIDKALKELE
jgi:hypothetical protein